MSDDPRKLERENERLKKAAGALMKATQAAMNQLHQKELNYIAQEKTLLQIKQAQGLYVETLHDDIP